MLHVNRPLIQTSRNFLFRLPRSCRFALVFSLSLMFGIAFELFAIKTGLYQILVSNKTTRRYELDRFVEAFHQKLKEWTEEDMHRAGYIAPPVKG